MFEEEKYKKSDIEAYELPSDADEIFAEMHKDEFDVDEYFDATIDLIDLDTGYHLTILLSAWFELQDSNIKHNYIINHK